MLDLIHKYLSITNYSDKRIAFEDLFQSHPDYPSLFAVTNTLELLSIENTAAKISKEQLFELPDYFLALYKQQLAFVSKSKNSLKVESEKEKQKKISFDDFTKDWDGIVIIIEANQSYSRQYLKENLKWVYYILPVFALLISSIFYNSYNITAAILLLISIVGLVFSILVVKERLGLKNEIMSKFCNISPDISCNAVIGSEKGRINKWIHLSDLPFLFFGINLTSLLLKPIGLSNLISLTALLSLPIIVHTIWMQKVKLKKWCLLCLAITSLIVLQSGLWIFNRQYFGAITVSELYFYFFSAVFVGTSWLVISNLLVVKNKIQQEAIGLRKFKRNYTIFNFLFKELPVLKGLDALAGIRFGNENTDVRLLLILSPACKFCNEAFKEAMKLIADHPEKVSMKVLFNLNPQNVENPYKLVAESLQEINNLNETMAAEAAIDWYVNKIGLTKWKEKWEVGFLSLKTKIQLEQQYNWCCENHFSYTPVKIVNDKLFPNDYNIDELRYFIKNYAEEKPVSNYGDLVSI